MRFLARVIVAMLAIAGCSSVPATVHEPNTAWRVAYSGYGRVRTLDGSDNRTFFLAPARPESVTATHAALVLSTRSWRDFVLVVRVRTTRQLRKPHPHPWEVGWLLWHYTDEQRFYYLVLKPNGFELGKEDPAFEGQQRFLVTSNEPAFQVGKSYLVRVLQRGDIFAVSVNGHSLVRYADTRDPYKSGLIGLYTEDAAVSYQIAELKPIP